MFKDTLVRTMSEWGDRVLGAFAARDVGQDWELLVCHEDRLYAVPAIVLRQHEGRIQCWLEGSRLPFCAGNTVLEALQHLPGAVGRAYQTMAALPEDSHDPDRAYIMENIKPRF